MKKYVIFYYLFSDFDKALVDAESLEDAVAIAKAFNFKTGAVIVGVCLELSLNKYCHGE